MAHDKTVIYFQLWHKVHTRLVLHLVAKLGRKVVGTERSIGCYNPKVIGTEYSLRNAFSVLAKQNDIGLVIKVFWYLSQYKQMKIKSTYDMRCSLKNISLRQMVA